ncbi:unnamed protein product [Ectocarpus sp. 8 AP-2014]
MAQHHKIASCFVYRTVGANAYVLGPASTTLDSFCSPSARISLHPPVQDPCRRAPLSSCSALGSTGSKAFPNIMHVLAGHTSRHFTPPWRLKPPKRPIPMSLFLGFLLDSDLFERPGHQH